MLSVCLLTVILAACGGGGGGGSSDNKVNNPSDNQPTAVILSGTAAIGAPMSGGSVWLREADRTEHGPYPIDATGNYFIDVTGFTPPFHIKACSADGTTCLYSIATQEQHIANINPLTSWVVMKAAGVNDPADVFDNPALYSITEQELNDAINEIELELAGLFTKFNITQNFLSGTYIANASDNLDGLFDENLNIDFDFIAGKVSFTLNGKYLGCDYIDDAKNQDDPIEGAEIEDALATASVSGLGYNYPPLYQASLSVNTSNNSLSYVDFESRQRFDSTSMAVDVTGGTATITGSCTVTDTITNTTTPGYSYTATITDGSPDAMGIVINDSAGDEVYSSNGANDIVSGNFNVTP